jgi:hypothetical protein
VSGGSIACFERSVGLFTEQQIASRPHNAPQFVDDGSNLWLGNVLENGEDEAEIEGCRIGGEMLQVLNRTKIDSRLQRLGDAQQRCLAFESNHSFGELGQDGRQASEPAAHIACRREMAGDAEVRAKLSDVTLLEVRAQHRSRAIDVDDFVRSPNQTLHAEKHTSSTAAAVLQAAAPTAVAVDLSEPPR